MTSSWESNLTCVITYLRRNARCVKKCHAWSQDFWSISRVLKKQPLILTTNSNELMLGIICARSNVQLYPSQRPQMKSGKLEEDDLCQMKCGKLEEYVLCLNRGLKTSTLVRVLTISLYRLYPQYPLLSTMKWWYKSTSTYWEIIMSHFGCHNNKREPLEFFWLSNYVDGQGEPYVFKNYDIW